MPKGSIQHKASVVKKKHQDMPWGVATNVAKGDKAALKKSAKKAAARKKNSAKKRGKK